MKIPRGGQLTLDTRPWFTQKLVERVSRLRSYVNLATNTFAIAALPDDLKWGTSRSRPFETHPYLCHNGKPVTVLILAELSVCWFKDGGNLRRRGGVAVKPFFADDFYAACGLELNHARLNDGMYLTTLMCLKSNSFPDALQVIEERHVQNDSIWAMRFMNDKDEVRPCTNMNRNFD